MVKVCLQLCLSLVRRHTLTLSLIATQPRMADGDVSLLASDLLLQWKEQEDGILVLQGLQYLDVVTLIQKKPICKQWKELCTQAIDNKYNEKKRFQSNDELRKAVNKYSPATYCSRNDDINDDKKECMPKDAEDIAATYGYPINKWDVSYINDFSDIFREKWQFNETIASWDVSNATSMKYMFRNAESFNQDISSWDVSNVSDLTGMFLDTASFNKPIGYWDVSNATRFTAMFCRASSFNQDISDWNVSNAIVMDVMFRNAGSFNQDISSWDVSKVTNMYCMFHYAGLFNQDISSWNVSTVSNMRGMFAHATRFNQDLSSWDTSSVNCFGMFYKSPSGDVTQFPKTQTWFPKIILRGG